MIVPRRLLGLVLALLLAAGGALPAQALAQNAGDEQYQDPLAGEQEPPSTGAEPAPPAAESPEPETPAPDTSTSSDDGSGSGSAGTPEPAPAGAEPAPAAPVAESGDLSPSAREAGQLPRTGGDPVLAGVLGAALLAAGAALRVRGRAADGSR